MGKKLIGEAILWSKKKTLMVSSCKKIKRIDTAKVYPDFVLLGMDTKEDIDKKGSNLEIDKVIIRPRRYSVDDAERRRTKIKKNSVENRRRSVSVPPSTHIYSANLRFREIIPQPAILGTVEGMISEGMETWKHSALLLSVSKNSC